MPPIRFNRFNDPNLNYLDEDVYKLTNRVQAIEQILIKGGWMEDKYESHGGGKKKTTTTTKKVKSTKKPETK